MARADYFNRVEEILYGVEIGENPSYRIALADAGETISGSLVTFNLVADEGAEVKAGHVLALPDATTSVNCHAVYVTSVATDAITGINGFRGSPVVAASDLDAAVLAQNPLVLPHKIHKAIDTIFATSLWPEIFKFTTTTVTPDMVTGQAALPAATMAIDSAWQIYADAAYPIGFTLDRNVHATVAANTVLGGFDFIDTTTAYVTYIAKLVLGDEDEDVNGLTEIVSTGAAALCLGATVSETAMASSSKDNQMRGQRDVAASLWRDFLTLRSNYKEGLSRERGNVVRVSRG